MSLSLEGMLLCAAGAAYNIQGTAYNAKGDSLYNPQLKWTVTPAVFTSDKATDYIDACFVGRNATGIIVAARGTLFTGNGYLEDWLNDFNCEPEPWYNLGSAAALELPGKVHSGFFGAVKAVYAGVQAEVKKLLKAAPGTPVYVTGHSKGGGMAPLIAYLLGINGVAVSQVVTFAGPKPGNSGFKAAYDQAFPGQKHTRFENYGDLIPILWPTGSAVNYLLNDLADLISSWWPSFAGDIEAAELWDYQPVGFGTFINNAGGVQSFVTDPATVATDQLVDIVLNIGWYVDEHAVGDIFFYAHTIGCNAPGFTTPVTGYLSAVCPSLMTQCSGSSDSFRPRHA